MSLRALFYAYVIGGITFIPLVIVGIIFYTVYTSVPIADTHHSAESKKVEAEDSSDQKPADVDNSGRVPVETYDAPRTRKGWLIFRRTYEEPPNDTGYVNIVRSFLDTRTKDPKRLRPKDMWYVVLKGTVLYLYEDEQMTECEAAIELSGYDLIIYPEGLLDGELFARRNAICLKPKLPQPKNVPTIAREEKETLDVKPEQGTLNSKKKEKEKEKEKSLDTEKKKGAIRDEATAWFMFVRSNTEMEDWYLALIHASDYPYQTPTLEPLQPVFEPADMDHLVVTLDEQPDVIPMRWFNALIGRIFFSYYRTHTLEAFIIGRLMKKLSKVKRPAFLSNIVVTEVSVGNKAPTFSKPMLKELTKEGDASLEVHARYKGEVRITVEATATINLSTRLKTYTVKLVLAAILREIEGNMLIKVKRPPSNRIWYAFTQMPRIVLDVEPVVSDRQITWGMILGTIESRLKEIIQESVVLPNMDDIAFFESSSYQRRGGIWADASRKEKKATSETKFQTPLQGDEGEAQDLPSDSLQNNTIIPPQDRAEVYASSQQSPAPSNTTDVHTIPFAGEMETSSSSQTVRRRSRLSYTEKGDLPRPDSDDDHTLDEDRASIQTSDTSASAVSSRNKNEKIMDDSDQDGEDGAHAQPSPSPHGPRRSSSRRSLNNDHGIAHSNDSTKGAAVESSMTVPRRRVSDATSTTSTSSSPPGNSSFLSTLRSKDKQAIKDSAKEAMRKLGVNWGLRKEWTVVSSSKETTLEDPQVAKEDPSSVIRVSYADVRAAVAERKERGRASTNTTDGSGTKISISRDKLDVADAGGSDNNEDPVATPTSSVGTSGSVRKRSPSRSSNVAELDDLTTEARQHNPILIQPQGKIMTIPGIHASHRGEVMSLGYVAPSMTQTDNKTPTINSFYRRLMKNPTIPDQEASQVPADFDTDEEGAPPALSPPIQPRLAPPPLPPRSLSPTTTRGQTSISASEASPNSNQLHWKHETLESSEPLPYERNKQEDISLSDTRSNDSPPIKASLTSTPRSPPPLPPRRIQTTT